MVAVRGNDPLSRKEAWNEKVNGQKKQARNRWRDRRPCSRHLDPAIGSALELELELALEMDFVLEQTLKAPGLIAQRLKQK